MTPQGNEYFAAACDPADQILTHFADPRGGFFDTSDDQEELVVRPNLHIFACQMRVTEASELQTQPEN